MLHSEKSLEDGLMYYISAETPPVRVGTGGIFSEVFEDGGPVRLIPVLTDGV
jgi:hypothetical protein